MITIELKGVKEAMKSFDPAKVRKAASMAINKAARDGRSESSKVIRERFKVKAGRVNQDLKVTEHASPTKLKAVIFAKGDRVSLAGLGARWVRNAYGKSRTTTRTRSTVGKRKSSTSGVVVRLESGKKTLLPNAFMARGRKGKEDGAGVLQVFQRADLKNNKSGLFSPSSLYVERMLGQERVQTRAVKKINAILSKEFNRLLDRLLK